MFVTTLRVSTYPVKYSRTRVESLVETLFLIWKRWQAGGRYIGDRSYQSEVYRRS